MPAVLCCLLYTQVVGVSFHVGSAAKNLRVFR
jgi:hypothetical protein